VKFFKWFSKDRARGGSSPERRLLFVIGGASHNWRGPGLELYRLDRAFRASVDRADETVQDLLQLSPTAMFNGDWTARSPEEQRRSDILSMGLLHIGMIDHWIDQGVAPDGLLGLSLGEVGAAYASGAIDWPTAIRIYCALAAHVDARSDEHILYVVDADPAAALDLCATAPGPVHFAGEAEPGKSALLTRARHGPDVGAHLRARTAIAAEHPTKWPYHVPGAFDTAGAAAALAGMSWRTPHKPVYLASLGRKVVAEDDLGALHWPTMGAAAYLLAGASRAAFADGFNLMVNIGNASIGSWVLAAAPAGADVLRFDATPTDPGERAWERPVEAVRAVHAPARPEPRSRHDLAAPEALDDPFAAYERLRAGGPVQFLPRQNFWIVLGYDAVETALRDTSGLSNRVYARVGPVLMAEDPPGHLLTRRAVSHIFSPAELQGHAQAVCEAAAGLIRPGFDLVADYARPVAQAAARRLLAIPPSAAPLFADAAERYREGDWDIGAYVDRLDEIAPAAGALPELMARGEGRLDGERGRQLVRFLWMAATETSERVIVRSVLALLHDADLRARIRADRSLLTAFVDEVIRLYPPELMVPRTTTAQVRLGDAEIPAGQHVMLCLAAANRDPARFANPEALQLDRGAPPHLSLGAGIHKCSGTALSRVVVVAALDTLLAGAPGLRATEPLDRLSYFSTLTVKTPRRLLVAQ
jgi:cytochrome P450